MKTNELQYRLLYSLVVAGKSATFAENALRRLFDEKHASRWRRSTPFGYIRALMNRDLIDGKLRLARTGCYRKLTAAFGAAATCGLDLRACGPSDLELIHGCGPKTARFFILWTRSDAVFAALDTHVMKWLGYRGHTNLKSTPSGKAYEVLEKKFLAEARDRNRTPRDLDAAIWDHCTKTRLAWGAHLDSDNWPEGLK